MKNDHPIVSALMVAFGLRPYLDLSEQQFQSARQIGDLARTISADTQALIEATAAAAGEFNHAE